MSRTVAALYDTRAEAETAYARLSAEVKADNLRILSRETAAAVGGLSISAQDAARYREGLAQGAFLLVGEVAASEEDERIVRILQGSTVSSRRPPAMDIGAPLDGGGESIPLVEEQLRVGKKEVLGGGAKVRTFTREQAVEQPVTLREERVEVSTRESGRRLSLDEVRSGGLLKDRVIQVSEMREEPVIAKEPFVREEVVLSKTATERTQVISDTVRRTEVDIDEFDGTGQRRGGPAR